MNIEDIICDFEYAKKLKELGIKQDSNFYYEKCPDNFDNTEFIISSKEYHDIIAYEFGTCHSLMNQETYSAFTADELNKLLNTYGIMEFKFLSFEKIANVLAHYLIVQIEEVDIKINQL